MTKEQEVTFETAKLLRREGFAERCRAYYLSDGSHFQHSHLEVLPKGQTIYECPTQAVVMRWLREEYRIAVSPMPYRYPGKWKVMVVYLGQSMEKDDKYDICMLGKVHGSYEEAAEAGIRHVVKDIVAAIRKELKRILE